MKKILIALCALFAAVTVSAQEAGTADPVKVGDRVPDVKVQMFDGSTVALKDLRGKVVLLNFWATWCPPCNAELARVGKEIVERFKGEEFVFIPVSRGETKDAVAAFRAKKGYKFPMGLDTDKSLFTKFADRGIPRNFLIDRNGKVVKSVLGYEPDDFDALVKSIESEINNKPKK